MKSRNLKNTVLALAAVMGVLSCTDGSLSSGMKDNIKDHSFEFTAATEHLQEKEATAIHLTLQKGDPQTDLTMDNTVDGQESDILLTSDGKTIGKEEAITTDSEGKVTVLLSDTSLSKGDHTLSLVLCSEHWEQTLDVKVTISYQPFLMRHSVSELAASSSELMLELVRGDIEAGYTVHCEVAGPYGYSIDRTVTFPEDRHRTVSLPLTRPGSYRLHIAISDGKTTQEGTLELNEILRDRYRTLRLKLSEGPQGEYSVTVPENPYRIGLELSSVLTVNGSCDYDGVYSDRDGDWPDPRTAYSEESDTSESYSGYYTEKRLRLHSYMDVHNAIREHSELSAHFSACEGDYGYPSSCVSGYSNIYHQPYEEILRVSLHVTDPMEGVAVTISHDITQSLPKSSILLNGEAMEKNKTIICPVKR